jgi:hypothetical protein
MVVVGTKVLPLPEGWSPASTIEIWVEKPVVVPQSRWNITASRSPSGAGKLIPVYGANHPLTAEVYSDFFWRTSSTPRGAKARSSRCTAGHRDRT